MMSGSKAPDSDAYGLFRATHSHNPTLYSHGNIVGLSKYVIANHKSLASKYSIPYF